MLDRLYGAFASIARGANPTIDYQSLYRARIMRQSANLVRVDVQPEDKRLPSMADIPLKTGVPGINVKLRFSDGEGNAMPPITVMVGWENGKPNRPFAALWPAGDQNPPRNFIERLIVEGVAVELGSGGLIPVVDGVLTGQSVDPFTGLPHWQLGNASRVVRARKL